MVHMNFSCLFSLLEVRISKIPIARAMPVQTKPLPRKKSAAGECKIFINAPNGTRNKDAKKVHLRMY